VFQVCNILLTKWIIRCYAFVVEYTYAKKTLPIHEKTSLVDEKALEQLIEMGFDRQKATKALLINR